MFETNPKKLKFNNDLNMKTDFYSSELISDNINGIIIN